MRCTTWAGEGPGALHAGDAAPGFCTRPCCVVTDAPRWGPRRWDGLLDPRLVEPHVHDSAGSVCVSPCLLRRTRRTHHDEISGLFDGGCRMPPGRPAIYTQSCQERRESRGGTLWTRDRESEGVSGPILAGSGYDVRRVPADIVGYSYISGGMGCREARMCLLCV